MNEATDEIDLLRIVGVLWRRKLLMLAIATPFAIAAGIYALLAQSVYSAEAKVLFEPNYAIASGSDFQSGNALSRMESEVQIARSEEIILNVIKDLNLAADRRFDRRGRSLDTIADQVTSADLSQSDAIQSLERIRRQVESMVDVRQLNRSTLLSFTAETPYPDLSASLSNSFADNYISSQINSKVSSAVESLRVVRAAVEEAGEKLEQSQLSLSQYLLDNAQEISFQSGNVDIALLADDLEATQAAVNQAVANKERLQDFVARGNFEALETEFAVSSGDDLLAELQAQVYFELESQRRDLVEKVQSQGATEDLRARLDGIEAEISSLANERLDQLIEEAAVQQEKQASIRGQLEVEIFSADLPPEIASDLFKLQSDATSSREQYVSLVDRADELAVQTRTQVADSRIVARATIPLGPSGPNRKGIFAIGAVLGLVFAVGAALLIDVVWGGISSSKELEERLGSERFAIIPRVKLAKKTVQNYILDDPFGTLAESLRMLRAEIIKSVKQKRAGSEELGAGSMDSNADTQIDTATVVCITSSLPNEGKSTTALGLAIISAMSGQRVCLIDFDFRRPSLSDYTGLEPNPDLAAYLKGLSDGFSMQSLDYDFGAGELEIITGARREHINADQAISSGHLKVLMDELRRDYDLVIIDTPPVLAVAETQFLAQYSDQSIYCVRENYASRAAIDQSFAKMRSAVGDQNAITIALTLSASSKNSYYYASKSYAEST